MINRNNYLHYINFIAVSVHNRDTADYRYTHTHT